jgi:hypothetical protein
MRNFGLRLHAVDKLEAARGKNFTDAAAKVMMEGEMFLASSRDWRAGIGREADSSRKA